MKTGVIIARFQPVHNGHIYLVKKACEENEKVLLLVGSADKVNKRNPLPVEMRIEFLTQALSESGLLSDKVLIKALDDLTNESDNSHEWGFYLYTKISEYANSAKFTIYYSDGFEIITSWFPSWALKNNISLSLIARNGATDGISATKVREMIMSKDEDLKNIVPTHVYNNKNIIYHFISASLKNLYYERNRKN